MVSRRKTATPEELAPAPATPDRGTNGGPAPTGSGPTESQPAPVNVHVEVHEPAAKPARRRAPARRVSKSEGAPALQAAPDGQNQYAGDHAALLNAVQELAQQSRANAERFERGLGETTALVQALRQAVAANDSRMQQIAADSRESQVQLVQHTAQLNELVQRSQAERQGEEDIWDRLAAASEEFRQASERLIERMAEQMLRLDGKVQDLTSQLGAVQQQLAATQLALHENRISLHTVRSETEAAAEQIGSVLRECQDTTEMLQATRQEIRATKDEVEATSDVAMAAALQLEESRLRMQEAQAPAAAQPQASPTTEPSAPPSPSTNGNNGKRGRLGITVDANAQVVEVFPDAPAQQAGLQAGDRITAVDGQPIEKGADLPGIILEAETANEFTVEVQRGDATHLLTVHLLAEAQAS